MPTDDANRTTTPTTTGNRPHRAPVDHQAPDAPAAPPGPVAADQASNTPAPDRTEPDQAHAAGPELAYVTEQPGLPIRFESKRGCDQIRARVYQDPRLTPPERLIAISLSEYVNTTTYTAHPKQAKLAELNGTNRSQISRLLRRIAEKGVIEIDRCRTYCRYIFLAEWRGAFVALPGGRDVRETHTPPDAPPGPRCASRAHLDVRETHITGEPYVRNRRSKQQQQQQAPDLQTAAAADPDAPPELPPPVRLHACRPTEKQLRGIKSMGAELRRADVEPDGPDNPPSRAQADEVFSRRKAQIAELRSPRRAARPTEGGYATRGRAIRRCVCGGFVRASGRVAVSPRCDQCGLEDGP